MFIQKAKVYRQYFTVVAVFASIVSQYCFSANAPSAWVQEYNDRPSLFIDGQPIPSITYVQAGTPDTKGYSQMSAQGYRVLSVAIDTGWKKNNTFDYTEVDSRIAALTEANSNAYIILRVTLSAPLWWCNDTANSNELIVCADGTGFVQDKWGGTKRQSFASQRWLNEEGQAFKNLIMHIRNATYSKNVVGYMVLNGIFGEWHLWSPAHLPDNSEPMRQKLIAWCQDKYGTITALNKAWRTDYSDFNEITCATENERKYASYGIFKNIMADPTKAKVSDYWQCLHETGADALLYFCKIIKDETDNTALAGAFYGYTTMHWPQEGGHLAISKVLDSPYIDFLASPHDYQERALGDAGAFRAYPESIRLHGKLFFDEGDDRTYLAKESEFKHAKNVDQSQAIMKREALSTLTAGVGFWWFDMQRNWYDDTNLLSTARAIYKLADVTLKLPRESYSEVAVVFDPTTYYGTKDWLNDEDKLMLELCQSQLGELQKTGTPFDMLLINDLFAPNAKKYKVYLFLNTWRMEDAFRTTLISKLQRDGNVLVFVYAPGFLSDSGVDLPAMQDLTGMRFSATPHNLSSMTAIWNGEAENLLEGVTNGQSWGVSSSMAPRFSIISTNVTALANWEVGGGVAAGMATFNNWTSVYCGTGKLPVELLRALVKQAGVHIWTDAGLNGTKFWAGSGLFGVHTEGQTDCHFTLPMKSRVVDAFTGETTLESGDGFTKTVPAGSTEIYRMEPLEP